MVVSVKRDLAVFFCIVLQVGVLNGSEEYLTALIMGAKPVGLYQYTLLAFSMLQATIVTES